MTTSEFKQEAMKRIDRIPPERYEAALTRLNEIVERPQGTPGRELLKYAGSLSPEAADEIERAIEEGCEQVDHGGW
jgi:hypothetical protein